LARDGRPRFGRQVDNPASVVVQATAGVCECHAARLTLKQRNSERRFKLLHPLAHCRLTDPELASSGRETAALGGLGAGVKVREFIRTHGEGMIRLRGGSRIELGLNGYANNSSIGLPLGNTGTGRPLLRYSAFVSTPRWR